jgi:hypothetical protein
MLGPRRYKPLQKPGQFSSRGNGQATAGANLTALCDCDYLGACTGGCLEDDALPPWTRASVPHDLSLAHAETNTAGARRAFQTATAPAVRWWIGRSPGKP